MLLADAVLNCAVIYYTEGAVRQRMENDGYSQAIVTEFMKECFKAEPAAPAAKPTAGKFKSSAASLVFEEDVGK